MADKDQPKDVQQQTDADTNLSDEDLEQAAGGVAASTDERENLPGGEGGCFPGTPNPDYPILVPDK